MEIKLFNLKLKNFKGIKELEIDFQGQNTNIFGSNATGKTTIFDAFKWLFFDKDSNDKKDFNIKTLDSNNNPIHFLEHEVEATLIVDGQDIVFKKVYKEKWATKRGQEQQEFAGHETSYWIDEVPIKKKDYEERINNIIPESLFKLITDPLYFNSLLKKEKRELLINISGTTITDNDILNSKEQFKTLKNNLENRSVDDYQKVLQAKVKDLNKEKETIPVRIDELTNTLITEHNIDYEELDEEKAKCNEELQKIENEMLDVQERAKKNIALADLLATSKNELNSLKIKLEEEHINKHSSEIISLTNEKSTLENSLRINTSDINELKLQVEKDSVRKQELYKEWDIVNNQKLEYDPNSFVCPTCKREYDADKKEELTKQFESNFNAHKEIEKQAINKEGQLVSKRIEENNNKITILEKENVEITKKLEVVSEKLQNLKEEQQKQEVIDVTTLPEYQLKKQTVEQYQKEVDNLTREDTSEIQNRKAAIVEQINNINKQLNERDTQEKTKVRIQELESEEEKISQKIQELEAQQFQIEEFTKIKVELLENAINSKFELVKFRLFKTQINGGLEECCDTLVNGVPFSDVNNAHKILAGLDIIKTLIKFHNTSAPIFIDNRESINELCDIDTQVISLIVADKELLRVVRVADNGNQVILDDLKSVKN